MSIKSALAKLRSRNIKFSTLKAALEVNQLPKSNGWENLEKKFAELEVPMATASGYASILERIYRDNVQWGDKAVLFAEFDVAQAPLLQAVVSHQFKAQLSASSTFPAQVTEAELDQLTLTPKLVKSEVNDTGSGATLYFYSRAYLTFKETFSVEDMRDAASMKRFAGYDHVVAYRQLAYQRIDSIYVDAHNRRIEFRVDVTHFTNLDRMSDAFMELKDVFRSLLESRVDPAWGKIPFKLANFFPKIDAMYNGVVGTLVQLGHNTAAGAINHGKMRGLRGDLKMDPSHVASMTASTTEKFAIRKVYSYYSGVSSVHLTIPGKSAVTGSPTPTINLAIVEDCIDGRQFEDMMQILR